MRIEISSPVANFSTAVRITRQIRNEPSPSLLFQQNEACLLLKVFKCLTWVSRLCPQIEPLYRVYGQPVSADTIPMGNLEDLISSANHVCSCSVLERAMGPCFACTQGGKLGSMLCINFYVWGYVLYAGMTSFPLACTQVSKTRRRAANSPILLCDKKDHCVCLRT